MSGQMCWLPKLGGAGDKILHLRVKPHDPWMPYTSMGNYSVPDYPVPRGSKGWATYQKLLKAGWDLVPTKDAYKVLVTH